MRVGCCAAPGRREAARRQGDGGGREVAERRAVEAPPPGMAHMVRWQQGVAADGAQAQAQAGEGADAREERAQKPQAEGPDGGTEGEADEGSSEGSLTGSGKRRSLSSRALAVVSRMTRTADAEGCAPCEVLRQEAQARAGRLRQLHLSKQQVMSIALEMAKNIDVRDRKHMLRRYPLCFLGAEAVRWMIRAGHASSPEMAILLGRTMEDEGLLAHFFREHPFEDSQNFYVFLGPCGALVHPKGGCESTAQVVCSTAQAAAAAAAAAEAACSTTPGCRLLRFLAEHDLEPLYEPLFVAARMEYHDVMLAFAQPDAEQLFIEKIGLEAEQFAALQMAVSESIDRRLEKLGRERSETSSSAGSDVGSKGSERDHGASGRGDDARRASQDEEDQVRREIEADANEGPAIRSWVIEDPNEIERSTFIAEGTTGKVYKGQWQGMPVAVKVYKPGTLTESTKANAMNEVQLMRRMQHQCLLRLYGACMTPPHLIIVSELCVGSLSSLLYGRLSTAPGSVERLTPRWEHAFIKGIATGVSFLHKHNVAHRDLKSANVLFDRSLMPKLCDFAFSKHKLDMAQAEFSSAVGTPQWMAPEVLRGHTYTTSADIWSFGVVVWEIKHRKRPYEGISAYAVSYKVASEGLRPEDHPELPQFWRTLMDDCFTPEPEKRPSSHDILQRLIDESPAPSRKKLAAASSAVSAVVATVSPSAGAAKPASRPVTRMKSEPAKMISTATNSAEKERKLQESQDTKSGQELSSPASAPASAGGSWGALGARGDTAATLAPQQWQASQPSATATALAMVLDARDARMAQMNSPPPSNTRTSTSKQQTLAVA